MPLVQTTPPSEEPVSIAEAKNHLRVDSDLTQDDALIGLLIGAARRYAESYCGRSFVRQGWRLVLDSFPGPSTLGVPGGVSYSIPRHAVLLERGNVISLDSISYIAMDGSTVVDTSPQSNYAIDLSGAPARITPKFGKIWPIPLPQIGSVWFDYTAGYGGASNVPEGIKHWILLRLTTLYENREEVAVMNRGKVDPLPFVDGLLDPYRVVMV